MIIPTSSQKDIIIYYNTTEKIFGMTSEGSLMMWLWDELAITPTVSNIGFIIVHGLNEGHIPHLHMPTITSTGMHWY